MRLIDVEDDDQLEAEEFEGLISSNVNQNAMRNTLTRPPPPKPSRTCNCLQYILITIALLCAFFIGRDYDVMSFDFSSLRGNNTASVEGLDVSTKAPEAEEDKDKENVFESEPSEVVDEPTEEEPMKEEPTEEEPTEEEPSEDEPSDEVKEEAPHEPVESENTPDNVATAPPTESPTQSPTNAPTESSPIDSPEATPEDTDTNPEIEEKWGKWKFYDGAEDTRPTEDYCSKYPNRDIPSEDFPANAWQTDAVYVNHFINEGLNLVERVKEAILEEYGHGKRDDMTPEELVERRKMFDLTFLDIENWNCPGKNAGCTNNASFDGLVKRLLHAMLTNDSFTLVLGGHSAAAGHGNHFKQSYTMQFFRIMEPVFKRLGVKLAARNIAQGGLGTMQTSLGARSLYGEEVDVIIWDSGMTEPGNSGFDLFARQALLGSNRAPVLYHGTKNILTRLHEETGADIFFMGNGDLGIPTTIDEKQVLTLPWATRYMKCDKQRKDLCGNNNKFKTKCWIERPDFTPTTKQDAHVGSQVSWHPGFRTHQLTGRLIAFVILDALEQALNIWSENTIVAGHPLADEFWHVTDYYQSIQSKAKQVDHSDIKACEELAIPQRVCNMPLYGRTEFTPRANPAETSILSILKPKEDGTFPPYENTEMLYEGPDPDIPSVFLPDDAIDVRAIAGVRRNLESSFHRDVIEPLENTSPMKHNLAESNEIVQGDWFFTSDIPVGTCGGEYNDICGRQEGVKCLLSGHMDHRGGIQGHSTSGWLVMNLKKVKGFIMIKIESWHGVKKRRLADAELDKYLCNGFIFEYAINGKITSLNKSQFTDIKTHPQRVVEVFPLLDDESMEEQDIEVAIQIRGCENEKKPVNPQFKLTHIYWASSDGVNEVGPAAEDVKEVPVDEPVSAGASTESPTQAPTNTPTQSPTQSPTGSPVDSPTIAPTISPTQSPTEAATESPTQSPTNGPTESPTQSPTDGPTEAPTQSPTDGPTEAPTLNPTQAPTGTPTVPPTESPTQGPTIAPTQTPTQSPTENEEESDEQSGKKKKKNKNKKDDEN